MEKCQKNNKKEFLTRGEIKVIISAVLFTAGVVAPFWSVKVDVATIKTELIAQNKAQEMEIKRIDKDVLRLEDKDNAQDETDDILKDKIAEIKK